MAFLQTPASCLRDPVDKNTCASLTTWVTQTYVRNGKRRCVHLDLVSRCDSFSSPGLPGESPIETSLLGVIAQQRLSVPHFVAIFAVRREVGMFGVRVASI